MTLTIRIALLCSGLLTWLGTALPAHAIMPKDREALEKYFTAQGKISFAIYAPPNGPDCGAALIDTAGGQMLFAARKKKEGSGFDTLFSESLRAPQGRTPFVLLMGGRHLLTYDTTVLPSTDAIQHVRGTLRVRDLMAESGAPELFLLRDVDDLNFESTPVSEDRILLWQPLQNFLNTTDCLPIRNSYFALNWDYEGKKYILRHHLEVLEGTQTDDGANMNNRAIFYYEQHRLKESADAFNDAAILASSAQSKVLRNHQLVSREIYELSQQTKFASPLPFSEARLAFWQGDYAAVLDVLDGKQPDEIRPQELCMLVLSLAHRQRWADVDRFTPAIATHGQALLADTLGELFFIARAQGHREIQQRYLTALENVDRNHADYRTGIAVLLLDYQQDVAGAQRLLEQYLQSGDSRGRNVDRARLMLFSIYYAHGKDPAGELLINAAGAAPITDLAGFVALSDFRDLSASLREVQKEEADDIVAPTGPLDSVGFQESLQ